MPFASKPILPVLPKPDHLAGTCQTRQLSDIEDKELRKKLRNRQSALAARERKKARMLELERKVAELQQTNKTLEEENRNLRCMLSSLLRATGCKNETNLINSFAKGNCEVSLNMSKKTISPPKIKRMPPLIADFKPKTNDINTPRDLKQNNMSMKLSSQTVLCNKDINAPPNIAMSANNQVNCKPAVKYEMSHMSPIDNTMDTKLTQNSNNVLIIKQETNDENYSLKYEGNYPGHINDPSPAHPSPTKSDENSIFAQTLKRKARAMVLSTNADNMSFIQTKQEGARKRQALPSIDAVFSSPNKVSKPTCNVSPGYVNALNKGNPGNNLPPLPKRQETSRQFEPQELIAMDSSLTSNSSWYLPTIGKNTVCDPILSPTELITDSMQPITTHCNELPPELSEIIDGYSSSGADESNIAFCSMYDNNVDYSPTEKSSGNSPDSGLGLDDDIDWMPSVFDFS